MRPKDRYRLGVVVVTTAAAFVPQWAGAAAKKTKAGDACKAAQTGQASPTAPTLTCSALTLKSKAKVWKWLPVDPVTRVPSDATIKKYGGVVQPAPVTTTVAPTTAAPAPAPTTAAPPPVVASSDVLRGPQCLEGSWTADFQSLNAYLAKSTGQPGPFFAAGAHRYTFKGGTVTGSGSVAISDPTGLTSGSATALTQAQYSTTDSQLTITGSNLMTLDIRVGGQPVSTSSGGGSTSGAFDCAGSTLTISTPGAGGATAALVLTRTN